MSHEVITGVQLDKQPRGVRLLHDRHWMNQFTSELYKDAERTDSDGRAIDGSSLLCFHVNHIAAEKLQTYGIPARYVDYERSERKGHAYINVPGYPSYLVDFQYKQFVPETLRSNLPDYLVVSYTSEEEFTQKMIAAGVPENRHWNWKEELFREQRPLSVNYTGSTNFARSPLI